MYLIVTSVNSTDLLQKKFLPLTDYVEGELLVKSANTFSRSSSMQYISSTGNSVKKKIDDQGLVLVKLADNETVQEAMAKYKATSAYELVQPNYRYYAFATANDTNFSQQWGLKNTGQTISNQSYSTNNPGTSGNDIDAESAWGIKSDCSSITVGVIDTGINYNHADLTSNKWVNSDEIAGNGIDDDSNGYIDDINGYDFVDNDAVPLPADGSSHGTHVAGTIGAKGDNNAGITGVCKTSSIMSIRVLGLAGGTTANIVAGLNYAVKNGAKVVNMSLGGSSFDSSLNTAINNAKTAGVVVVVAAGNDAKDTTSSGVYPCNFTQDNLLCVASIDQSFSLATSSNYSTTHVDIGAPGTNILSAWPGVELTDDFSTGWTGVSSTGNADVWVNSACIISGTTYDTLVYPEEQCGSPYGPYSNNQDDRAYKSFDLSSYQGARLEYYARIRTEKSFDIFSIGFDKNNSSSDPFDSSAGDTILATLSGDKGTSWLKNEYSLSNCLSEECSIGFKFISDANLTNEGVSITALKISFAESGSTTYKVTSGTSMASPHAAGVAALVYASNSGFGAADVVNAIKSSGIIVSGLSTKIATGKVLNAYNALRYIQTPTDLTAVINN